MLQMAMMWMAIAGEPVVTSVETLAELSLGVSEDTLVFLDIDDTVLEFPHTVGSKKWRHYLHHATDAWDTSQNWHDVLTLWMAENYPVCPVEPITCQWVMDLQAQGAIVCGLTARERNKWYDTPQDGMDLVTARQLKALGVSFDDARLQDAYPELAALPQYFQGTFFVDMDLKGDYLLHHLAGLSKRPKKIIFVDDKWSQAMSVAKALHALGIPYESYCYTYTDAKAARFDPVLANIQLYFFHRGAQILSDEEAARIAREDLTRSGEDYLKAVVEAIRKTHPSQELL